MKVTYLITDEQYDCLIRLFQEIDSRYQDLSKKDLCELTSMEFTDLELDGLIELGNLTNLEYLCLEGTTIEDLTGIEKLVNLQALNIRSTNVVSLVPITNLKLVELAIDNSMVTDLRPILTMKTLEEISLDSNLSDQLTATHN